ncbi:MAG: efflux RND transporter periplasmic adaptor subunit [Gammaproteobacteria bacterium AqS3]|nr:efflux RND transporter periplasmic adaptor subunit [Gammaproteobacteria bacterium AqS3]
MTRFFGSPGLFVLLSALALGLSAGAPVGAQERGDIVRNHIQLKRLSQYEVTRAYPGEVRAQRRSRMAFQVSGTIAKALVEEGDSVRRGQVLLRLDRRLLRAAADVAQANLKNALAVANLSKITLQRNQLLYDRGHISKQRHDQITADHRAASAGVDQARASLRLALVNYEYGELKAPYDGRVQGRFADEGAVVTAGTPVLELVESNALEVIVGLPAGTGRSLGESDEFTLMINGAEVPGRLLGMTPALADGSRTLRARFAIPQDTPALAGDLAELSIALKRSEPGFWVPMAALSESMRGLWAIYVLVPKPGAGARTFRIERRLVDVLHSERNQAYVQGSVEDGECILTGGVQLLVPGQDITLRPGNRCGG